jgi:hypothetical protein
MDAGVVVKGEMVSLYTKLQTCTDTTDRQIFTCHAQPDEMRKNQVTEESTLRPN